MKRIGDLEIDQDLEFQQREWRVQRVFWAVLVLVVVLGMIGLFGTGPISSATSGSSSQGISVSYERFVRHGGEAELEFTIQPDQVQDGQVEIWISSSYLDDLTIEQYSIEPDEVRSQGERQVFVFLVDSSDEPASIRISIRPDKMGRFAGEAGIVDGPSISFSQLSYP